MDVLITYRTAADDVLWSHTWKTSNQNYIFTGWCLSGAGTAYHYAPHRTWVHPGFQWDSCYSICSFMCMICSSLFVLLYFFFWSLCCLFFDIQILITHLVSSNSSYNSSRCTLKSYMKIVQSEHYIPYTGYCFNCSFYT